MGELSARQRFALRNGFFSHPEGHGETRFSAPGADVPGWVLGRSNFSDGVRIPSSVSPMERSLISVWSNCIALASCRWPSRGSKESDRTTSVGRGTRPVA